MARLDGEDRCRCAHVGRVREGSNRADVGTRSHALDYVGKTNEALHIGVGCERKSGVSFPLRTLVHQESPLDSRKV